MCTGVTKGLANRKFSGSVRKFGMKRITAINNDIAIKYPRMSFVE
jgi:hypothetical protein